MDFMGMTLKDPGLKDWISLQHKCFTTAAYVQFSSFLGGNSLPVLNG